MASATSAPACSCCSLQPHLLRRPATLALRHLPPTSRPLRLPLPFRLQAQASASPEPSPESSFAGWSEEDQDKEAAAAGPFGGLLGPGLAELFFLAGITYAAISIRNPTGSRPQIEASPTHSQTASHYADDKNTTPTQEDDAAAQDPLQTDRQDADSDASATTAQHQLPGESNEVPEGEAAQLNMEHTLEGSDTIPMDGKYTAGDGAGPPEYLTAFDDGTGIPGPADESSDKLGAAAGTSEGTRIIQDTSLDSEPSLVEKHHMDDDDDDALTSDIMVLDSGDVVAIQDAATEATSHLHEKEAEQNPQLSDKDDSSAARFPDYVEYGNADQELKDTLPSAQDEQQNELEDQNELLRPYLMIESGRPIW